MEFWRCFATSAKTASRSRQEHVGDQFERWSARRRATPSKADGAKRFLARQADGRQIESAQQTCVQCDLRRERDAEAIGRHLHQSLKAGPKSDVAARAFERTCGERLIAKTMAVFEEAAPPRRDFRSGDAEARKSVVGWADDPERVVRNLCGDEFARWMGQGENDRVQFALVEPIQKLSGLFFLR